MVGDCDSHCETTISPVSRGTAQASPLHARPAPAGVQRQSSQPNFRHASPANNFRHASMVRYI